MAAQSNRPRVSLIGGIAMLDVISNALLAMVVLFFEMITIQEKPAPLPTTEGMLIVTVKLILLEGIPADATAVIFLRPPQMSKIGIRFDEDIRKLEGVRNIHSKNIADITAKFPAIIVGAYPGQNNQKTFSIRNPVKGKWEVGVLYADHKFIDQKIYQARPIIEAWFVRHGEEIDIIKLENIPIFESTTNNYSILIEVPVWLDDSQE